MDSTSSGGSASSRGSALRRASLCVHATFRTRCDGGGGGVLYGASGPASHKNRRHLKASPLIRRHFLLDAFRWGLVDSFWTRAGSVQGVARKIRSPQASLSSRTVLLVISGGGGVHTVDEPEFGTTPGKPRMHEELMDIPACTWVPSSSRSSNRSGWWAGRKLGAALPLGESSGSRLSISVITSLRKMGEGKRRARGD